MTTGTNAMDPKVYGDNTGTFVLKKGEVVEIILNNMDPGKHPFHLHGHEFQVVFRSDEEAGSYNGNLSASMPQIPMRRDTVLVRPNGHIVLRFLADNPDELLQPFGLEFC